MDEGTVNPSATKTLGDPATPKLVGTGVMALAAAALVGISVYQWHGRRPGGRRLGSGPSSNGGAHASASSRARGAAHGAPPRSTSASSSSSSRGHQGQDKSAPSQTHGAQHVHAGETQEDAFRRKRREAAAAAAEARMGVNGGGSGGGGGGVGQSSSQLTPLGRLLRLVREVDTIEREATLFLESSGYDARSASRDAALHGFIEQLVVAQSSITAVKVRMVPSSV
eukprot:jgi/Mesvir1/18668/Mv17167-RA.1